LLPQLGSWSAGAEDENSGKRWSTVAGGLIADLPPDLIRTPIPSLPPAESCAFRQQPALLGPAPVPALRE